MPKQKKNIKEKTTQIIYDGQQKLWAKKIK